MDRLRLAELAHATGGELRSADASFEVSRVSIDSRTLNPGDLFWALPGERTDGHQFAAAALERGAAAVVCQADRADTLSGPRIVVEDTLAALQRLAAWYRARQDALIIGVTGSVGKTTTRGLIHAALSSQFSGVQSPASFNNHLGVPLSLLEIEQHHEFAVLEFGASHVGEIRDLTRMAQPEVGVITAIGRAHLAGFGGIDGIIRGKGELLEALPTTGFAVLPGDDPITRSLASRANCRTLFVGEQADNAVQATHVAAQDDKLTFAVDNTEFSVSVTGRHHLTNALIAVAIAREIGIDMTAIAEGLSRYVPSPGRCEWKSIGPWRVIDDTYNASPTAMNAALEVLSRAHMLPGRRRYAVLGDMLELGDAAGGEHHTLGATAAQMQLDGILTCGEWASAVAEGASRAGIPPGRIVATPQLDVLLTVLDCWLEPGDVVLVKGSRGMQMERVIDWLRQRANDMMPASHSRCA